MSGAGVTDQAVNTLAQVNQGLDQPIPQDGFCRRILESCLECSEEDAIFFIWCSLEQALEYQRLQFGKELEDQGLRALCVCTVNGKRRGMQANQQLPSSTAEYFVVAKKGDPTQTTFEKWGKVYDEDNPAPKDLGNVFKVPQRWWDSLANRYPYEKPRELMRLFVNYFARPGMLVFEGFAGTISCGLAALTSGVNLVAVDNNVDTHRYLEDLYSYLRRGVIALEELCQDRSNIGDFPDSYMFLPSDFSAIPTYQLYAGEYMHGTVPVVQTEQNPFIIRLPNPSQSGLRRPNFPRAESASQSSFGLGQPADDPELQELLRPMAPQKRARPDTDSGSEDDDIDNASKNSFGNDDQSPDY